MSGGWRPFDDVPGRSPVAGQQSLVRSMQPAFRGMPSSGAGCAEFDPAQ